MDVSGSPTPARGLRALSSSVSAVPARLDSRLIVRHLSLQLLSRAFDRFAGIRLAVFARSRHFFVVRNRRGGWSQPVRAGRDARCGGRHASRGLRRRGMPMRRKRGAQRALVRQKSTSQAKPRRAGRESRYLVPTMTARKTGTRAARGSTGAAVRRSSSLSSSRRRQMQL